MVETHNGRWLSLDRLGGLTAAQLRARVNRQKIISDPDRIALTNYRAKVGDLRPLTEHLAHSEGDPIPAAVVRDRTMDQYVVIGGERRYRALTRNMALPVHVIVCDHWGDYLAWMLLDKIRENPAWPSKPMPLTDIVHLHAEIVKYLSPGRDDHLDDTLAEYFGTMASRIGEARSLKRIMDRRNNPPEIQAMAEREWALVANGQASPSAAFQRVRKAEIALDAPGPDVRIQRSKLDGSAQVCAGLADALANFGEASDELKPAEVDAALSALGDGRRALERVIRELNQLKQRRAAA